MANPYEHFKKDPESLETELTTLQYQVTQKAGTEPPFRMNTGIIRRPGFMSTLYPVNPCLRRCINSILAQAGPVFTGRLMNEWFNSKRL